VYDHYIGVDLHASFFQACSVTATGERVWETRFPRTADGIAAFLTRCQPTTAIAVEATGPTWHFVDAIHPSVGTVEVIDAFRTRLKAGYAAKTDRLDARRLADALRRESVVGIYYPPPAIREWRELCRYRHTLVHTRSALVQRVRALLLRQGIVDARRLAKVRDDAWLDTLSLPPRAKDSLAGLRRVLHVVRAESVAADDAVRAAAASDPVATALQRVVGIGPLLAMTMRAEIGDIRRFPTAAKLASYAGLVPRIEASASRVHRGRITRQGSPWLRWALVEAAMHAHRREDRTGRWVRRLAVRKGALTARVAAARRLCVDVFARWPAGVHG
jgi:transposase